MNPIKIEQKIVAQAVVDTPTSAITLIKAPRPDALSGTTYKVATPHSEHALYITINDAILADKRVPFEIFINSKDMQNFQWIVALTRVISAIFRTGIDTSFLIEELRSVFDPKGGHFKKGGRFIPSLVAEIGDVIAEHVGITDKSPAAPKPAESEEKGSESGDFPENATLCPKCLVRALVLLDGCVTCLNCGDSKCG